MNDLSLLQLLDEVLLLLHNSSARYTGLHRVAISDLLKAKGIDVSYGMLTELINKLERDKYIRHELGDVFTPQKQSDIPFYILTIEGEMAIHQQGYVGMYHASCRTENRKVQNERSLTWATWGAAIGTLSLTLWEIYSHFFYHSR